VDGSTRYQVVTAMLLNGFLLVSDCVAIPGNPWNPPQKILVSKNSCNAMKNFPKEKVKARNEFSMTRGQRRPKK